MGPPPAQAEAVDGITTGISGCYTPVLTGPPGSGKTTTVMEVIRRVRGVSMGVVVVSARWLALQPYADRGVPHMSAASFCCSAPGAEPTGALSRYAEQLLADPAGRRGRWDFDVPAGGLVVIVEEFSAATGGALNAVEEVAKRLSPQSYHFVLAGGMDQTPPIADDPPLRSNLFWEMYRHQRRRGDRRVKWYALWETRRYHDPEDWRAKVIRKLQTPAGGPCRTTAGKGLEWWSQQPVGGRKFDIVVAATNAAVDRINLREQKASKRRTLTVVPGAPSSKKRAPRYSTARLWQNGPAAAHLHEGGRIEATPVMGGGPVMLYNGQPVTVVRWPCMGGAAHITVVAGHDQRVDHVEVEATVAGRRVTVMVDICKAGEGPIRGWSYMPLVAAAAITVHKAQGMTVDSALVYGGDFHQFGDTALAMLIVALSRSRHPPIIKNFCADDAHRPSYNTKSVWGHLHKNFEAWFRRWRAEGGVQPPKPRKRKRGAEI